MGESGRIVYGHYTQAHKMHGRQCEYYLRPIPKGTKHAWETVAVLYTAHTQRHRRCMGDSWSMTVCLSLTNTHYITCWFSHMTGLSLAPPVYRDNNMCIRAPRLQRRRLERAGGSQGVFYHHIRIHCGMHTTAGCLSAAKPGGGRVKAAWIQDTILLIKIATPTSLGHNIWGDLR